MPLWWCGGDGGIGGGELELEILIVLRSASRFLFGVVVTQSGEAWVPEADISRLCKTTRPISHFFHFDINKFAFLLLLLLF